MRKFFISTFCFLAVSAVPVWSQPATPRPQTTPADAALPVSVFSATTVNDFLVACRADQGGCVDEVGSALVDKFEYNGDICLPSVQYAQPVPAWLSSHAETHTMPTEDGIYLALKVLYPCG